MLRRKRSLLLIALVLCVGVGVGFVAILRTPEISRDIVRGESYPRWPAENAVDWVGFADQFAVANVLSERQLPRSRDEEARGEGYVGREITVQIDSVVWQRSGAVTAPSPVTLVVDGWWEHDRQLIPFASNQARRVEVGDRLLMALLRAPEGAWSQLSPETTVVLAQSGDGVAADSPESPAELRGKNIEAIADLLSETSPNAVATRNRELDPDARAKAVWDEQLRSGGAAG